MYKLVTTQYSQNLKLQKNQNECVALNRSALVSCLAK